VRDQSKVCGAKRKGRKGTCQAYAGPNGRCRIHGGQSLRGVASPKFKSGRHSKYLPKGIVKRYEESLNDPRLLELRDDIAMIDARITEVIGADEPLSDTWKELARIRRQFEVARRDGHAGRVVSTAILMSNLVARGARTHNTWEEVAKLVEQRRRLVESERKREVDADSMLTVEQVGAILGAVLESLRRNVSDRTILSAIQRDLDPILTGGLRGEA